MSLHVVLQLFWFAVHRGLNKQPPFAPDQLTSFGSVRSCLYDAEPDQTPDPRAEYLMPKIEPDHFLSESFQDAKEKLM